MKLAAAASLLAIAVLSSTACTHPIDDSPAMLDNANRNSASPVPAPKQLTTDTATAPASTSTQTAAASAHARNGIDEFFSDIGVGLNNGANDLSKLLVGGANTASSPNLYMVGSLVLGTVGMLSLF
ncbi:hypothetical protein GQ54DRAFT_313561 [Martensiomyces pterosporus]|nr:hypothetical protein GQ54DRAFT_313561 [Martensiomyces pterosporus]